MKLLFIVIIAILTFFGQSKVEEPIKKENDLKDNITEIDSARKRTAELIGSEIELAYTSYLMRQGGNGNVDDYCKYMTSSYFKMNNATLDNTSCPSNKSVKITASGTVYTAKYINGSVEITGAKDIVTVKLK